MFKWTKLHGCNCTPLHNNGEKYLLNIGNIYKTGEWKKVRLEPGQS
jgi:hypothetical protein